MSRSNGLLAMLIATLQDKLIMLHRRAGFFGYNSKCLFIEHQQVVRHPRLRNLARMDAQQGS